VEAEDHLGAIRVSARHRILVALIVVGVVGHSRLAKPTPRRNSGKAMETTNGDDEQAWRAAEEVARHYFEGTGHKIEDVEAISQFPYFFLFAFDVGRGFCLVSEGKVVEAKGLPTLGQYLKASGFRRRHAADSDSFLRLIQHLAAYPPDMATRSMYLTDSHPELYPKLEWAGGGARFVLHYATLTPAEPHSGGRIQTGEVELEEWTLHIPADYHLAWKQKIISVPSE
jgi:hypothetical protein